MKNTISLAVILVVAVSCSSVRNTHVDWAHDYDFSGVKTFRYLDTPESNATTGLMNDRVASMIRKEMVEGGLTEVDEGGDLIVTYHFTTEDQTSYITTTSGYGGYGGWGPGWGGWGYRGPSMTTSRTYETTYTDGTLIIDIFEPANKKLVWRGTGTVTVKDQPEKQVQQIDQILTAIGDRWEAILAGHGK